MFDFKVSIHDDFDEACLRFTARHNITELAGQMRLNPQTLRNKLNPAQAHQLTCMELLDLTDMTEDASLLDGLLAQINCMPAVPVNEIADKNLATYTLQATAAVGSIAASAATGEQPCPQRKSLLLEGVNAGIRHLSLIGLLIQGRVEGSPAFASAVGTIASIATNGMV